MKRGEIYWYTFKPPDKRRPVLILTRNSAIPFLNSLTVAPITNTVRDIPSEVILTEEDGLESICAVNMDNIQTIQKQKIDGFISLLSLDRMEEVNQAIAFALGLDQAISWIG
jgi:mRNA interferase MazF